MKEIKDKLQFKLDKVFYPLIELGASMRIHLLLEMRSHFTESLLKFDTTDNLRENIIYHEEHNL
jgi:hypothetical protein